MKTSEDLATVLRRRLVEGRHVAEGGPGSGPRKGGGKGTDGDDGGDSGCDPNTPTPASRQMVSHLRAAGYRSAGSFSGGQEYAGGRAQSGKAPNHSIVIDHGNNAWTVVDRSGGRSDEVATGSGVHSLKSTLKQYKKGIL